MPVPVARCSDLVGGVTVSLPWIVPLKGTWCVRQRETASGDDVEDAPIDDGRMSGWSVMWFDRIRPIGTQTR